MTSALVNAARRVGAVTPDRFRGDGLVRCDGAYEADGQGCPSELNMATLLFAPQPLAYARGSVRRRFGAANVRERMRNYL